MKSDVQEVSKRYKRRPEYDRRIGCGDDFAGDAWEVVADTVEGDGWTAQRIVYTVVGYNPNKQEEDKK